MENGTSSEGRAKEHLGIVLNGVVGRTGIVAGNWRVQRLSRLVAVGTRPMYVEEAACLPRRAIPALAKVIT